MPAYWRNPSGFVIELNDRNTTLPLDQLLELSAAGLSDAYLSPIEFIFRHGTKQVRLPNPYLKTGRIVT